MGALRYYFSIFLRRLHWFLIVATVIAAASVVVAMTLPPAFVSQMRLIVESPQIPDELAAPTSLTPAQEQMQIMEQRLMTRANLIDIANRLEVLKDQDQMSPDEIEEAMRARTNTRISSGRDEATLMTVTFEARRPQVAAAVLNEYLTLIQNEDVQTRTGRAVQTLEFFEQEVARLNESLAKKSSDILTFKTANADALPESLEYRLSQQSLMQERLAQIERDLFSLTNQRERLVEIFNATGNVSGAGGQPLTAAQQQLETLRNELNEALAVYSPENPRVRMLKARISQVEQDIASQPDTEPENAPDTGSSMLDLQLVEIDSRLTDLKAQRESVEAQLEKLADSISRTPANAIRLDELTLDYENIQLQYNTAVDRLSKASTGERIEFASRGQKISVIEPPAVPSEPTKPNRLMIAGGGSVFGMMAGLGLILLLELVNRTIRRPEDLVSRLSISPIATIPYIRTRRELLLQRSLKVTLILLILLGIPAAVLAVHLYYQPLDLIAERIMNKLGMRW